MKNHSKTVDTLKASDVLSKLAKDFLIFNQAFSLSNRCNFLKLPRIPMGFKQHIERPVRKTNHFEKSNAPHLSRVRYLLGKSSPDASLKSTRVSSFKEQALVSQNLKNQPASRSSLKQYQAEVLGNKNPNLLEQQKDTETWQEFIHAKKERYFQLTRMT